MVGQIIFLGFLLLQNLLLQNLHCKMKIATFLSIFFLSILKSNWDPRGDGFHSFIVPWRVLWGVASSPFTSLGLCSLVELFFLWCHIAILLSRAAPLVLNTQFQSADSVSAKSTGLISRLTWSHLSKETIDCWSHEGPDATWNLQICNHNSKRCVPFVSDSWSTPLSSNQSDTPAQSNNWWCH